MMCIRIIIIIYLFLLTILNIQKKKNVFQVNKRNSQKLESNKNEESYELIKKEYKNLEKVSSYYIFFYLKN